MLPHLTERWWTGPRNTEVVCFCVIGQWSVGSARQWLCLVCFTCRQVTHKRKSAQNLVSIISMAGIGSCSFLTQQSFSTTILLQYFEERVCKLWKCLKHSRPRKTVTERSEIVPMKESALTTRKRVQCFLLTLHLTQCRDSKRNLNVNRSKNQSEFPEF